MRKWIISLVACATMGSAYAGVIAAWDFNAVDNTASAGWTTFVLADGASDTVNYTGDEYLADGGVTLTQAAAGTWSTAANQTPVVTLEYDPALLTAANTEIADGFAVSGTQDFTLSGLVEGQAYRLQFIGTITFTTTALTRNLTMAIDGASTPAVSSLFNVPVASQGSTAAQSSYSQYLDFIADSSEDVVITFGQVGAGNKAVGGLIVATIPEPATLGMITMASVLLLGLRRWRMRR